MRNRLSIAALAVCGNALAVGCGGSSSAPPSDGRTDAPETDAIPTADWVLAVDPAVTEGRVGSALLGQYELSGSLFDYGAKPALLAKMRALGFSEWRIGVGRWEVATRLLPNLADGMNTSCASVIGGFPAVLKAPSGATDTDLVASRDWFTRTNGNPVTLQDTADDSRYSLAYIRSVIDQAIAFGATPYVDIDHMPFALSANQTFYRGGDIVGLASPCLGSWSNRVSNVRPANPNVFAAAVVGMVRRVVEGSGGQPGRDAMYWEVWNEPELGYAWDQSLEQPTGSLNAFFAMTNTTLVQLDAYRTASTSTRVKALKFGLGSFARATTAASVIGAFDTGNVHIPADFVSFHSYSNDPLEIVADIERVATARAASTHYRDIELSLSEWGPQLDAPPPRDTMAQPLLISTVLARGAALGLERAHHSLFYDFIPGVPEALVTQEGTTTPSYHAYELLHELIGTGADRLAVAGVTGGSLDGGDGAVLVTHADGPVRVLLVNRGAAARTARIDVAGAAATPTKIEVFDDPAAAPRTVTPAVVIDVPASAIVLVTM